MNTVATITSADAARLPIMLSELRLPTIKRLWSELAEQSNREGWPAERFLGILLGHEMAERETRRLARARADSQLPSGKTLAEFDFAAVSTLSKAHVMALAELVAGRTEQVARAVLQAGMALPERRLPELWCGTDRESDSPPESYRNSCSPQAWAAGSPFQLVTALLGLEADAGRGRLRIAPVETPLWRRLEVTGLHFAGHRIDFSVEGTSVKLGTLPRGIKVDTRTI